MHPVMVACPSMRKVLSPLRTPVGHDRQRTRARAERGGTYRSRVFTQTRHWYPAADALARFGVEWKHSWVFAWRDIARSTDERTFIATIVPSLAVPHTAKVIFMPDEHLPLFSAFVSCVGSFLFDFIARQKTGGTHMSGFIVEQLPVLGPTKYGSDAAWSRGTTLRDWLTPRVLELIYTAWISCLLLATQATRARHFGGTWSVASGSGARLTLPSFVSMGFRGRTSST